ncbi:MAG: hypothetical protein LAQ69_16865 [Acidobacteriia bacterium]|nr:hypothetical protein [Terriglobia bacterium]
MAVLIFPACLAFAQQAGQAPQAPRLNIVIVEGEGAINNIKQRTSRETIVQVEDENHKPIAGAAVVFLLPGDGPGGAFVDGSKSATLVTDSQGQAMLPRMQPNQLTGNFQIRVNASYQGRQASATISQSNVAGAGPGSAAHAGISGKAIGIIVGVVAAGAVGAAVALSGGKGTPPNSPPPPPTGTITAGSASLGPPQ